MVLQIRTQTAAVVKDRSLIPECLQERAPLRYEIRDEDDRRVTPTLAGYKLRRGKTYSLRVKSQANSPDGWRLTATAPRSLIEPHRLDAVHEKGRELSFDTRAASTSEPWRWMRSQITTLNARMDFDDGKETFRFSVPIVILASRLRFMIYFVGSLLLTILTTWFKGTWTVDNLIFIAWVSVAILTGLGMVSLFWDQVTFYRHAKRLKRQALGISQTTGMMEK